jgi:ABC-type multidrug transport system fused ATPase/permease subunit
MQQQLLNQVKGDLFTYMLGLGVIILGFFLFLSILDNAKIARKQAKLDEGKLNESKEEQYITRKQQQANAGKAGAVAPTAEEKKNRDTARETWDQETSKSLQNEIAEARISANAWRYWYTWGAFVGAMLVTIASVAYVATGQTTTRRVTGAVMLVLLLVTFLGAMIGKGPAITLSP